MPTATSSNFPWRKGCILLLFFISAILTYDILKHGTFEASSTGKFMKRSGISAYGQKLWTTTKHISSQGLKTAEASSPEYYKAAVDISTAYMKLAGDFYFTMKGLSIKLYNNGVAYVEKNGPIVLQTIEDYIPGMLDEVQLRSNQGLNLIKVYSVLIAERVIEHSSAAIKWLEHNVFVGKLSPENLQSYATRAIDTTQTLASQTYDWVYEKVQTLSKVP